MTIAELQKRFKKRPKFLIGPLDEIPDDENYIFQAKHLPQNDSNLYGTFYCWDEQGKVYKGETWKFTREEALDEIRHNLTQDTIMAYFEKVPEIEEIFEIYDYDS